MRIAVGSDHGGYHLKEKIKVFLLELEHEVIDVGCYSEERSDYPDFAHPVAEIIEQEECHYGILICRGGNGVGMTANKHSGIRAAVCWNPEIAKYARLHNDANIITLPGNYMEIEEAKLTILEFFNTEFEGGRHIPRVQKINLKKKPN